MPTLPTPMTETLVWRLVGEGGAVCWMGLKKAWVRSRPPGPKDDAEPLLCMLLSLSLPTSLVLVYVAVAERF